MDVVRWFLDTHEEPGDSDAEAWAAMCQLLDFRCELLPFWEAAASTTAPDEYTSLEAWADDGRHTMYPLRQLVEANDARLVAMDDAEVRRTFEVCFPEARGHDIRLPSAVGIAVIYSCGALCAVEKWMRRCRTVRTHSPGD